jgi:hypothetical protein
MGNLSAVEISATILTSLKERAEKSLGGDLMGAVITVPAYFDGKLKIEISKVPPPKSYTACTPSSPDSKP